MAEEMLHMLIEGYDPAKVQKEHIDEHWKKVLSAYQNDTILQAPITAIEKQLDKHCAVVKLGHVRGYIPMELTGVDSLRQLRKMTGKPILFKVLNYDREGGIFTASRKEAMQEAAAITLKKIRKGDLIIAVANEVTQTQVKADIGGIEVKIPIEEMSYGWIDDLTEAVKAGDHLHVKVMGIEEASQKVSVSVKAALDSPWPDCAGRYQKGNEYVGTVSGVREYGVFINLETGVDSLSRHLKFQNVSKGDQVLVRILEVDAIKQQIRTRITRII